MVSLQELFIDYLAVTAHKQESDSRQLTYKGLCKYCLHNMEISKGQQFSMGRNFKINAARVWSICPYPGL